MDSNKQRSKNSGKGSSQSNNNLLNLQQQMALAAQMGISPGMLDLTFLQAMAGSSDMDLQRMLAMQTGTLPYLDPATALHTFGGLGGLASPSMPPGMIPGGADLMAMAQQAQFLAALGGGLPAAMMPHLYGPNPLLNTGLGQSNLVEAKPTSSQKCSTESSSAKPSQSRTPVRDSPRPNSNASSSRMTPSGVKSPCPPRSGAKSRSRPSSSQSTSSKTSVTLDTKSSANQLDGLARNLPNTEEILQREMMRQLEQQFLLQQMQIKQQQDQIQAALSAMNLPVEPSTSNSRHQREDTSHSDKIQQALSQSIYQQLLGSGPAVTGLPSTGSYFESPQALEQMMALSMAQAPPSSSSKATSTCNNQEQAHNNNVPGNSTPKSDTHYKKSQLPADNKERKNEDRNKNLLGDVFSGASATPFTGDVSNDVFLAAIFDQLQKHGMAPPLEKKPSTRENIKSSQHDKATAMFSESPKPRDSSKEKSYKNSVQTKGTESKQKSDSSSHRRKQANPQSIFSSSQAQQNASAVSGKTNSSEIDSSSTEITGESRNDLKMNKMLMEQPISLVKEKRNPKADSAVPKHEVNVSETLDLRKSVSPIPSNNKNKSSNATSPRTIGRDSIPSLGNISEKDFLLAMQSMAKDLEPLGGPASIKGMDDVFLTAYNNFLKSGQPDNNINNLLTAGVAAEMRRLQQQQMNLTKKLEMLSKGDDLKEPLGTEGNIKSSSTIAFDSTVASMDHTSDRITPLSGEKANSSERTSKRKRRRPSIDEEEVLEPLKFGWTREVYLKPAEDAVRAEVFYVTPGGKKLSTYFEVLQHLEDNASNLQRSNFSFSSRLKIGTFYERRAGSKEWMRIAEDDLDQRLKLVEQDGTALLDSVSKLGSSPSSNKKNRSFKKSSTPTREDVVRKAIEEKLRKDKEQQALKLAVAELKLYQREHQKNEGKLMRHHKLNEQQVEQERKERELYEQERQKLEVARQYAKYQEVVRKNKVFMAQQQMQMEREERRRHLLLMKAIETKRRAEEKSKRKEEKIFIKEKKMEQRRRALQLARELKMPVEDMCLNNHHPLPMLNNLQGTLLESGSARRWTQLSGNATADVLMVLEFLYTFKHAMYIDENVIPTFEQLQRGLLNDTEHTGALVELTMALLHQCLCDPGVPAPGPWLHCMIGVKVTDVDVSKTNYSEILRLFIWARNGRKNEITQLLETEPFPSLTADQKAGILAFLVNELVCSAPVCVEIEKSLETLSNLRRDKWLVEGKIRQARIENANDGSDASISSPVKHRSKHKNIAEEDGSEKSGKEDTSKDEDTNPTEKKPSLRSESLQQQKMNRLTKEHQSFNDRLSATSKPLRALQLGQDRYKRRYWVLSNLGGIYVEGLESGRAYDEETSEEEEEETVDNKEQQDKKETKEETHEINEEQRKVTNSEKIVPPTQNDAELRFTSSANQNSSINTQLTKDIGVTSLQEKTFDSPDSKSENTMQDLVPSVEKDKNSVQSSTLLDSSVSNMTDTSKICSSASEKHLAATSTTINPATMRINSHSTNDLMTPGTPPIANSVENNEVRSTVTMSDQSVPSTIAVLPTTMKPQTSSENPRSSLLENQNHNSTADEKEAIAVKTTHTSIPLATEKCELQNVESFPQVSVPSPSNANTITTNGTACALENSLSTNESRNVSETSLAASESSDQKDLHPTSLISGLSAQSEVKEAKSSSVSTSGAPLDFGKLTNMMDRNKDVDKKDLPVQDSVEVAAKAIAAKAVASSSHLLYPDIRSNPSTCSDDKAKSHPTTSSSRTERSANSVSSIQESGAGLSEHMSKALHSIGMDASHLSPQQIQALLHIKEETENDLICRHTTMTLMSNAITVPSSVKPTLSSAIQVEMNKIQDLPIDLSKSSYSSKNEDPKASGLNPLTTSTGFHPDNLLCWGNPFMPGLDQSTLVMSRFGPVVKSEVDGARLFPVEHAEAKRSDVNKEATPIPKEMKRGWWKICNEKHLNVFCESLHSRGLREKHLHRAVTKNRKYCIEAMNTSNSPEFQFANGPNNNAEKTESKKSHKQTTNKKETSKSNREKSFDVTPGKLTVVKLCYHSP